MSKKSTEKTTNFSNPTRFMFGGKYYTILTAITYPKELYNGFLSNINSVNGVKVSIKHIPVTLDKLRNQVSDEITELRNAINNDKNPITQQQYREDIDDLTTYYNELNEVNPRVFAFQMHLIICGDNEEELDDRLAQVQTKLSGMDIKALPLMFEQEKVLKSCVPIFPAQDIEKKIGNLITSFNLASMYPFIFDCLKDNGSGTILGTDYSGGIILFNQYLYLEEQEPNRNNANMMILGSEKMGKTSLAKLLFRTNIRNGHKCFFIDPDGSMNDFIAGMSGDFIQYGKGSHIINPLEVIPDADEEEISKGLGYTVLTRAIGHLKAFILYIAPHTSQDTLNILEKVAIETYARFGISTATDFSTLTPNNYPVIDDLYATVRGKLVSLTQATPERNALDELEKILKPFTENLRGYFNGKTNIMTYSNCVSFDCSLITDENLRNALMFNTLRYCYSQSLSNDQIKSITMDKFEYLVTPNNPYGLGLVAQIQRKSAKFLTGLTLIYEPNRYLVDQNLANDFKTIFENTSYYMVMGIKKNILDYLSSWISFNETESENIRYYSYGNALLICGRRRMSIKITLTPDEQAEFNTQ